MAPPALRAWLKTFIRYEIGKALEWKESSASRQEGDGDDDHAEQLFEDDGSNFRSHVNAVEAGKDLVQLIKV